MRIDGPSIDGYTSVIGDVFVSGNLINAALKSSLDGYQTQINTIGTTIDGYATTAFVDGYLASYSTTAQMDSYVGSSLIPYATTSFVDGYLVSYSTTIQMDSYVATS